MRRNETGSSKMTRICCSPLLEARQPGPSFEVNTDSTGKEGFSEVTSTVAILSRLIQSTKDCRLASARRTCTILLRIRILSDACCRRNAETEVRIELEANTSPHNSGVVSQMHLRE